MKQVTLFTIPASHPCATVERALSIKGMAYRVVELPPPLHVPIMRLAFGVRTVPAAIVEGEKITGSVAILRRLDELVPEPALFPADPEERAQVEEAERWGEDVLQPLARRILWQAVRAVPDSLVSFSADARVRFPPALVRLLAPIVIRAGIALNRVQAEGVRRDVGGLPVLLDRIDRWIFAGVLGDQPPNAADLQIASSLRLLMALEDLRPVIADTAAGDITLRIFPDDVGHVPAGALPPEWLAAAGVDVDVDAETY